VEASVATKTQRAKPAGDLVDSFAGAVAAFTSRGADEILPQIPHLLVSGFGADRAELWLWDGAGWLTHAAGQDGLTRQDPAMRRDSGAIGAAAQARKTMENVVLSTFGGSDQEFARASGLSHLCCYPLTSKEQLLGVLAIYTAGAAPEKLLKWWRIYADMTSLKVQGSLEFREKDKQITQLSLLFEATRLLNSTLDLSELLELILKIARNEVKADRGSVFLLDSKNQELWSIVAMGLDRQEIRVPLGRGVAGQVAQTGKTVNVEDAYALDFFDPEFDEKFAYRTRSLLCLPIRHHNGQIVGVIQLLNQSTRARFSREDEEFLSKLSGHMAMALENARLHREELEKQRLEKELALARDIQRSLLPESPPIVPGYEIAVSNEPCFEVGGDYYDFLNLGPQSLLLVVADVEGKGVSSALVMSNLQATLRALVMHLHSLEVLTLSLNEMIYNDTKSEKFLSIFLGLVDTRRHGLHYINAGHVPPVLIRAATGKYRLLEDGGTVVGLFPTAEYMRGSVKLEPGDVLICCTDGILEAENANEEEFGVDRLAACVTRHRSRTAQAIVDSVLQEVNAFAVGGKHSDDKVLMIMKVSPDGQPNSAGKPVNGS